MKKLLVCFALMMIASPAMADPTFPALQGKPVLDSANVIPDDQEAKLNERLFEIMRQSKHQVMVLTVPSLQGYEISEFGTAAGRFYGVGSKDSDDGILLTVAPTERKVRIDTGRGMEGLVTDAEVHDILADIKSYLKNDDYPNGISQGVEDIAKEITPLTPEQLALQKKAAENAAQRSAVFFSHFKDFLMTILGIAVAAISGFGLFRLATLPARRRAIKQAEEERVERQRVAEIEAAAQRKRQMEQDAENEKLRREEEAREEARREKHARQERERVAAAVAQRQAMLAAMSVPDRKAFLKKEEETRQEADREAARQEAYARARQQEENKRREEERTRQAEIDRARRAREEQEEEERAERRRSEERSSSSSSSDSYSSGSSSFDWGSSSSSGSDSSFSGGGGDFGGGGGDASF